ncbi:MAG: hypothetical protein Q9220_005091 [cf. Caloplaca sp. 1 TL-2023]
MPNIPSGPLVFYPSYCFALSPTFNTWVRLTAADVHGLVARTGFEGQNIYFHLNHPIRWIRLVGLVVAFDVYPNRITMTLDDSSGLTIEIFCKKEMMAGLSTIDTTVDQHGTIKLNSAAPKVLDGGDRVCTTSEGKVCLQEIDVGSVVKIKGSLSEFRGEKQATLERICMSVRTFPKAVPPLAGNTNEEVEAWAQNTAFYQNVLSKPWAIGEREQQQAKLKAMGVERKRKVRKEQKGKKVVREEKGKHQPDIEEQTRARRQQRRKEKQGRNDGKANRDNTKRETAESDRRSRKTAAARQSSRPAVPGTFNALGL